MTRARASRAGIAAVIALASAFVLSACGQSGSPTPGESSDAVQAEGTWESDESGRPHLVLGADGTAEGSDGCNGISTTYTLDGDTVRFARFVSTLMACPGVDSWLSAVRTGRIDGDTMTIEDGAGEEIGTLYRAS